MLAEIVLADETHEDGARDLVLEFHPRNNVAADEAPIAAPPVILIVERPVDSRPIARPETHRQLN